MLENVTKDEYYVTPELRSSFFKHHFLDFYTKYPVPPKMRCLWVEVRVSHA